MDCPFCRECRPAEGIFAWSRRSGRARGGLDEAWLGNIEREAARLAAPEERGLYRMGEQDTQEILYGDSMPKIQWFPGHMAKTRRMMKDSLKLVDIVVELVDARIPLASRNPELDEWVSNKPRLILLNKADMADEATTRLWISWFEARGVKALATACKNPRTMKAVLPAVRDVLAEQIARWRQKGMENRPVRMMIVGIPNVGKSSFINAMAGGKRAKVEDRPGVTRGKQWVSLESGVELLDMPGVLWPKFEDQWVGLKLAFTGAVKDAIVDVELLAVRLLDILKTDYRQLLAARYKVEADETADSYELLQSIGRKRGMLVSGGEVNTERAAIMLLDEYRAGKLGRLSLEKPPRRGEA